MTLAERAEAIRWYHTLELHPGVVTEGMFNLRPVVDQYRLPARLDGSGRSGFRLAKEARGSNVERVGCSTTTRAEDLGTFDFVFCGSVLLHLRDHLLALERIAALCRDSFVSAEAYDPWMSPVRVPLARYRADRERWSSGSHRRARGSA